MCVRMDYVLLNSEHCTNAGNRVRRPKLAARALVLVISQLPGCDKAFVTFVTLVWVVVSVAVDDVFLHVW